MRRIVCSLLLVPIMLLGGCGTSQTVSHASVETSSTARSQPETTPELQISSQQETESPAIPTVEPEPTGSDVEMMQIPQTGMTEPVPSEYMESADQPGSVVRIDYESKDYVRDSSPVTKTAYVYLPYGYDENDEETRYDILYLMHGWGGHEGEYFTIGEGYIKNMLDHLIENKEIPPVIAVSPTFYNENSSRDFGSSDEELRQFHQDFVNHLMPAIEGQFHTYAESTTLEDLAASRDHRAFGGFSLGSVTTWMEFCYDSDYIRYFLPMSGACWYFGGYGNYYPEETCNFFEELLREKNLNERGYFIYATTGTGDNVRSQVEIQMEEMLARSDVFTPDHVVYYQKEGGLHDFDAVQEYIYNALPLFFENKNLTVSNSIAER